jgi:hypothetical protein
MTVCSFQNIEREEFHPKSQWSSLVQQSVAKSNGVILEFVLQRFLQAPNNEIKTKATSL